MNITKRYKSIFTAVWGGACLLPLVGLAAQPDFPTAIGTNPVTVAEYRVVGVTAAVTNGAAEAQAESGGQLSGFAAMDRLCQLEYPGSRMATAREWQTSQWFAFPAGVNFAWLDPGPLAFVFDPTQASGSQWAAYMTNARPGNVASDSVPSARQLSCLSYGLSISGLSGTAGAASKRVSSALCNATGTIACAALVAVPVSH